MQQGLSEKIKKYASAPLFFDASDDEVIILGNPYRRPTRTFDNDFINYTKPLTSLNQASNSALSTHRHLLNIYESDMLFLPETPNSEFWSDFSNYYSDENIENGEAIRSELEHKAFSFLEADVDVSGTWTADTVVDYFQKFLESQVSTRDMDADTNLVFESILDSHDPKRCAKHYLIQFASDFLSEASAMARLSPGAYGEIQSAIFNILIDEYGASVHANKHSTLFENTMKSVGLDSSVHHYWQFYHPTSLSMTNYFHYVTKNKRFFFRYLGALFYTESSLVNTTKKQSQMLKRVFGKNVDTQYFDEHHHIDQHHGEMALRRVVIPALEQFGDVVAKEIIQGFLEFQYLEQLSDMDMLDQFRFFNRLESTRLLAERYYENVTTGAIDVPLETFVESEGERSTTHTHPDDRLLVIESGTMNFWPLYGDPMDLGPGDILQIPKHRLHGSVVTSDECVYHQPIASYTDIQSAVGIDLAKSKANLVENDAVAY